MVHLRELCLSSCSKYIELRLEALSWTFRNVRTQERYNVLREPRQATGEEEEYRDRRRRSCGHGFHQFLISSLPFR
jgi:hypothetical protein